MNLGPTGLPARRPGAAPWPEEPAPGPREERPGQGEESATPPGGHLPFLATVGSISVYIGLFGTVWGIMSAFRALGTVQQATLAMVAPGISEALIATALGLFAFIPALCAYNRFSHSIEELIRNYDHLAEEFLGLLHRQLYLKC